MFQKDIVIPNETGLHARPASGLVRLCKSYKSKITICTDEKAIDAKSIIMVLAGGLKQHTPIRLEVEGEDEAEAGVAVSAYIEGLVD